MLAHKTSLIVPHQVHIFSFSFTVLAGSEPAVQLAFQ